MRIIGILHAQHLFTTHATLHALPIVCHLHVLPLGPSILLMHAGIQLVNMQDRLDCIHIYS